MLLVVHLKYKQSYISPLITNHINPRSVSLSAGMAAVGEDASAPPYLQIYWGFFSKSNSDRLPQRETPLLSNFIDFSAIYDVTGQVIFKGFYRV